MIIPDDYSVKDLLFMVKDDKRNALYPWLDDLVNPRFKPIYFYDTPIYGEKKILRKFEYRYFEEGIYFLTKRLYRENYAEEILVPFEALSYLQKEIRKKVYTYQFSLKEVKKRSNEKTLLIFDYFQGVSKIAEIEKFLELKVKANKTYYLFPFLGGRYYSHSFTDLYKTISRFPNITLINYHDMLTLISSEEAKVIYKKDSLLVGISHLEKLMALHGAISEEKIEGECVKKLPFGNSSYLEIYKPYTDNIKSLIDYEDPLVLDLASSREFSLHDPWLKYLVERT